MIPYLIKNNNIKKNNIDTRILEHFNLQIVENDNFNTILGNPDVLIDINDSYINILLFNDHMNIKALKDYFTYGDTRGINI